MPTVPGRYCVNYWRTVLDEDGRYEHGVAATVAPAAPPPDIAPAGLACPPAPVIRGTGSLAAGRSPA
jgi:hypothetical protein